MSNHNTYNSAQTAPSTNTYDAPGADDTYDGTLPTPTSGRTTGEPPEFKQLRVMRDWIRGR